MTERILGPAGARRRRHALLFGPIVALALLVGVFVTASAVIAAIPANCTTADTLDNSIFEIDAITPVPADAKKNALPTDGANLTREDADCADWATVTEIRKTDSPSGSGDESFGQGTAENDAVPTIVSGSIPPQKSDLKSFGVYKETGLNNKTFVAVFWSRINSPQGTTNMDFEFNKNTCDGTVANPTPNVGGCSANGVTPSRSSGDKLLLYDLSSGGSNVDIHIRTWDGTQWGSVETLSASSALGSINYNSISAANADGLGALDPLTFGEAVIDFNALLGGAQCGQFGSVYLKSRSSDSFTSEIKDFIPPQKASLSNCPATIETKQKLVPNDSATLGGGGTFDGTGTATFQLFKPDNQTCAASPAAAVINGTTNPAVSGASPVTVSTNNTLDTDALAGSHAAALGTWHWKVVFSGDGSHAGVTSNCIEAFTIDDDVTS